MMKGSGRLLVPGIVVVALVSAGCGGPASAPARETASLDSPEIKTALAGIRASEVEKHMRFLADDKLEGRGLGSAGYEEALSYVETNVKSYGLAPAGESGGFRQRVPLRNSVVVEDKSSMAVRTPAGK
jgi:hypothetical protein